MPQEYKEMQLIPDDSSREEESPIHLENLHLENVPVSMSERPLLGTLSMGSFSLNVGQEHCPIHNRVSEFISFNFEEREEKYCMQCIRDLIRERLIPLGEEYVSPSVPKNPLMLNSRYDLLKGKNASGCQ